MTSSDCNISSLDHDRAVWVNAIAHGKYNSSKILKTHCKLEPESESLLNHAMIELGLSARGYTKIINVSRTIAGIDLSDIIKVEHISEALQYRRLDRNFIE